MLQITVEGRELFDERTNEFVTVKSQTLQLEHSLVSISKWEAKWHKPFLSADRQKTPEEAFDYYRCMTVNKNVDPMVYYCLSQKNQREINDYIENSATATWFSDKPKRGKREVITSELIYYSMISLGIPFECEKWHLNRLLTLIHVCAVKNQPSKKMSRNDILSRNRALNSARRARSGSKG